MKALLLIFIASLYYLKLSGQKDDYVPEIDRYLEIIADPNIKTVLMYPKESPLEFPALAFGESDLLEVHFDDLSNQPKDLFYKIIHCNKDWTKSDLLPHQYSQGPIEVLISQYEYSTSAYSKYIHYSFSFPDEHTSFLVSGNYALQVYNSEQPDNPLFVKRFIVYEKLISLEARTERSFDPEKKYTHQQIYLSLKSEPNTILNPYENLSVYVLQNDQWILSKKPNNPSFVKGDIIEFTLQEDLSFPGGSEYRNLNLRSLQVKSIDVSEIQYDSLPIANLYPSTLRNYKAYETWQDINGKCFINNQDALSPHTSSEYVWTHFKLPLNSPLQNPVYLIGSVFNDGIWEKARLNYNAITKSYEKSILLKQGIHNYLFVTDQTSQETISFDEIEGNHWETENNYLILVYYRGFSDKSDRLIGLKKIKSINN